jgi:Asp-tRNA(Asn)/Glu-tRNA(Gln) amidotransferase A subunit family amidase
LISNNGGVPAVPFHTVLDDFRRGSDSPRDFLERCLERLEESEFRIKAFAALAVERSRMAADAASQRWREGRPLSPVDGMPVGVKDVIETFDLPTAMGSPAWERWRSGRDAAAVIGLREAGAFVLGKTKTTEFASVYPTDTRNPAALDRAPGGSSSGSAAAVAAGMVPAALGTQVMGSILRPASFCGIVGYKPTFGGINRGGTHDYMSQSCLGVLAASLTDAWLLAWEISRRAGGDPGQPGILGTGPAPPAAKPARLGLLRGAGWDIASAGAKAGLESAVARLRENGVTVASAGDDLRIAEIEKAVAEAGPLSATLVNYELRWQVKGTAYRDRLAISPSLRQRVEEAEKITPDEYRAVLRRREASRAVFELAGIACDAFLTLSASGAAPLGHRSTGDPIFNVSASFLGAPALSLPLLQDEGSPLGLQLIGRSHTDEGLFATAAWIDSTLSG